MISIVVPTYREADNLALLAEAVDAALSGTGYDYELLFIDDDSRDGSAKICAQLSARFPVRIVVRKGERGLATAVIHGISMASGDIVVVMDADLSHPASAIPAMIARLQSGESDFVLGSRYVEGGSIHDDWSVFRQLNSIIPSLMAKPLCPLKDPMSGFFAIRRTEMPPRSRLSPVGYKIALEIFVKGGFNQPSEVPIHFSDRQHGESKLSLKEQLNFLRHLGRLYAYKLRPGRAT
ncbi:MAG: polyprenol monophosphomannose synthase [Myxococcales bacterium]|nr:polyprenol monophosphomannose synthase [Myxococcales bacterium]